MSESAGSSYGYKHKGKPLQKSGMLTRQQLLHLFDLFAIELGKAEVKKRIADAVRDNQEPVAITTEIQEELLLKMGIDVNPENILFFFCCKFLILDPQFGISCLGKVNTIYENDHELMLQFYDFVAKEELACDEAELGPAAFSEKARQQQKLQEQQLMMLRQMRELPIDDQCLVLKALHEQMEQGQYENSSAVMTREQIQHLINRN